MGRVLFDKNKFQEVILFWFLVLLPFGQIIKFSLRFGGITIPVNPIDLVVLLGFLVGLRRLGGVYGVFREIGIVFTISFLLSVPIFWGKEIIVGAFYLIRLIAYFYFSYSVYTLLVRKKIKREILLKSLLLVFLVSAIFGWLQYFFFFDLRALSDIGWDDHYSRLTGTFLDPGFAGIVFVLAFITSLFAFLKRGRRGYLFLALFFAISVFFTYSRASYIALFVGFVSALALMIKRNRTQYLVLFLVLFGAGIALLPRGFGEGVDLGRVFSIWNRLENYKETIEIWRHYPLIGVGFNNICLARQRILGVGGFESHSCSGSDSSVLFILATTGIVGIFFFIRLVLKIHGELKNSFYKKLLVSAFLAVAMHSLFVNSMFYIFVLGYMGIVFAMASYRE